MKRTYKFAKPSGKIKWKSDSGQVFEIPLFLGILKHTDIKILTSVLKNDIAIFKYTCEAIKRASWPVLREFPHSLIKDWMKNITLSPERRKAIEFLLAVK